MAKRKFYVVWRGHLPGIYQDWGTCKKQIEKFSDAKYKSFESEEEACLAFNKGFEEYVKKRTLLKKHSLAQSLEKPNLESLSVDAACSGNPGKMEYRGVYTRTGEEIFRVGPLEEGTNNIGEFLALVHGLAYMKKQKSTLPVYSDSATGISWLKQKKCKTKLEQTKKNVPIFDLIQRAEKWLQENTYENHILKWNTSVWGEIPADFGRK